MKSLLLASIVVIALGGLGGCSCPCRVPVSLEPLNNWLLYHGPSCRQYPFSCPPCPYAGCERGVYGEATVEESAHQASSQRVEKSEEAPAPKPPGAT